MPSFSTQQTTWVLVDPQTPIPCTLAVVVPAERVQEIKKVEQEQRERRFLVRAILSDHIPLSGTMDEILTRPSYHKMMVNENKLTIYLHHGGHNAVFFDLVSDGSIGLLDYIEVRIESRFPSNCFWSARTAISQLLDSMMRSRWMPLTIRRLDLYIDGDDRPLCHQLILPFTDGTRWGPLGGIQQFPFLVAHEALIREAITSGSPFYRFLCAYRLYEGFRPLRKVINQLNNRFGVMAPIPKPQGIEIGLLKDFGFSPEFLSKVTNVEDFWKETTKLRHAVAHFLLDNASGPVSLSDGNFYHTYSLIGAILLSYSHKTYVDLFRYVMDNLAEKIQLGSILPMVDRRDDFLLRPDSLQGSTE